LNDYGNSRDRNYVKLSEDDELSLVRATAANDVNNYDSNKKTLYPNSELARRSPISNQDRGMPPSYD
jgi:hypothetical protein